MKPNFFESFFNENVGKDPVQLLAKTWFPYLFWVLRNLPHMFENWHMSRNLRQKNVTIWAPRKAHAPKNTNTSSKVLKHVKPSRFINTSIQL